MKNILKIVSYSGLALTIIPSFFVFAGKINLEMHYTLMFIGMVLWFFTAPIWVKKSKN
jgi:hypothetical protein